MISLKLDFNNLLLLLTNWILFLDLDTPINILFESLQALIYIDYNKCMLKNSIQILVNDKEPDKLLSTLIINLMLNTNNQYLVRISLISV